jgi:hypothetical protein
MAWAWMWGFDVHSEGGLMQHLDDGGEGASSPWSPSWGTDKILTARSLTAGSD